MLKNVGRKKDMPMYPRGPGFIHRFRLMLVILARDAGCESDFIKLQKVQTEYEKRFGHPLNANCFKEVFQVHGMKKVLITRFAYEFEVKDDKEGVIMMKLRHPFAEVKRSLIEDILQEGVDVRADSEEALVAYFRR